MCYNEAERSVRYCLKKILFFVFIPILLLTALSCRKEVEVVTLSTVSPVTPTPKTSASPVQEPENDGAYPTKTPQITFVPLPKSTSAGSSNSRTPTPTPEWTTPYPSPTGKPLVDTPEYFEVVTVKKDTVVRKAASEKWRKDGKVREGNTFRCLGEEGGFYKVDLNGAERFLEADDVNHLLVPSLQTDTILIRTATLNIHGAESYPKLQSIARTITDEAVDIIGLQEVKRGTDTGSVSDSLKVLSELTGLEYYSFCKTLNYDGGIYGTAILSRFPIVAEDSWKLDGVKGIEPRYLSYVCALTDMGPVDFFNTHLCANAMYIKSINIASMVYYLRATGVRRFLVSGDFNCSPPRIYKYMKDINFVNVDMNTFGDGTSVKIIDNILYTSGYLVSRVDMVDFSEKSITDHRMIVCDAYLLPEE